MPLGLGRAHLSSVALAAALAGCVSFSDPLGRQDELEDVQLQYTQALRWGDIDDATEFVEPSLRASFAERATAL